jgi:hypothetical protein
MIAALLLTLSLPVPPSRPIVDQNATCRMFTPEGRATDLTIAFRAEELYGRPGYWWTISGDDTLYPSNKTARYMYSSEDYLREQSQVYFETRAGFYLYTLTYLSGTNRHGDAVFQPRGYLTVYRRPYRSFPGGDTPIGIGFCEISRKEAAQ